MTREANPIPRKYIPATRFGNMIFTAGMTRAITGTAENGKIKATDEIADYKELLSGRRQECTDSGEK